MQRVKLISNTDIENVLLRTYIIYDDILSKYVFDVCGDTPNQHQLVMLDGGEKLKCGG